ncbi:MAG: hypothetical protein COT25_04570 [Candidatus Kerfeldbacteria bacterium CG08_land_8_20_14_0_20_42_7]|uniref:Uncharacterized protein n=1 Tax=Candidatus Kerfeldbacteria bacterium CG08_land_8_20_14_0_20_42_7 TaxID=2014245 RepID=A0A2H0YRP5_9BACT|nr:MAG: hypothetical protein COT25_04570 [Candidatus Kerfeldbacteria bacterium CG08_land_8_20_14_0_20_42_7]
MTIRERKEILSAAFIGTVLFRIFLIVLVVTFASIRTQGDIFVVFTVSLVTAAVVFLDIVLTLERIFRPDLQLALRVGKVLKALIISFILVYSVSIWSHFFYTPYVAFAVFVAFLYALDYVFEDQLRSF